MIRYNMKAFGAGGKDSRQKSKYNAYYLGINRHNSRFYVTHARFLFDGFYRHMINPTIRRQIAIRPLPITETDMQTSAGSPALSPQSVARQGGMARLFRNRSFRGAVGLMSFFAIWQLLTSVGVVDAFLERRHTRYWLALSQPERHVVPPDR